MSTEHKLFGFYLGLSARQKIHHLMKNYLYREHYIESYRKYVEGMIKDISTYERSRKDDVGVRIMPGNNISDITARKAEEAVRISNIFITGHIGESLIKDKEDRQMAMLAVNEWMAIRDDYASLSRALLMLKPKDHELMMDFLNRKKNYYEIAEENMITLQSAKKKVQRIRGKIMRLTEHDFARHSSGFAAGY